MKQNITVPPLQNIRITDPLFGRYVDIIAEKLIPYQWKILNDQIPGIEKSYCMENFRAAAGKCSARHRGMVFSDTDLYKWIETLAYCLEAGQARKYEPLADEAIMLISEAQEEDGYLNTYFSLNCPDRKWTNLTEGHELYSGGHLIEAAIAYYRATKKPLFMKVACRFADLVCNIFGIDGSIPDGYPGHQEIELALMKLFDITQDKKYADLAMHFLSVRGGSSNFLLKNLEQQGKNRIFPEFSDYDAGYAQSHLPPQDQTTAEGHAVRAMYMFSAMADVAKTFGDESMKKACMALWENVTEKRMYITGGLGSSGFLERFTVDYDLPNDRMYCESCASVGLMMFGQRMNRLTGDATYYDAVERALCNTVLAGISVEGDRYFYVNPLEIWPENCLPGTSMAHVKPVRQPWFSCACCPPNIARTLASLGQYIYAQDSKSIYINQFISSEMKTTIKSTDVAVKLENALFKDGKVYILICNSKPVPITIRIRIPYYLKDASFVFSGTDITPHIENGYAVVAVSQEGEQLLEISGKTEPVWIASNENVRSNIGKVALQYGPFVYCLEETDNGSRLQEICVQLDQHIQPAENISQLPGNLPFIRFHGKRLHSGIKKNLYAPPEFSYSDAEVCAVPYALWGNRIPGEMLVWLKADI